MTLQEWKSLEPGDQIITNVHVASILLKGVIITIVKIFNHHPRIYSIQTDKIIQRPLKISVPSFYSIYRKVHTISFNRFDLVED